MATISVRPATEADVPLILAYIVELAEFEKLPQVATEEGLRRALFGPRPAADVLLAEVAGQEAGFAVYFYTFSTFQARPGVYLEDLYVRPQVRSQGVGRAILAQLARLALDRGCARMEWSVLDWNERAIRFYKSLGARPNDEWTVYRLSGTALAALAAEESTTVEGLP